MKCLYWNIRSNNESRVDELFSLSETDIDIVFLSEVCDCQNSKNKDLILPAFEKRGFHLLKWVGDRFDKGLACFAKEGVVESFSSIASGEYNLAIKPKDSDITLVGVWSKTEKDKIPQMYCEHMKRIVDAYSSDNAIILGDFNVCHKVLSQKKLAPEFWKHTYSLGFESLYHHISGEEFGAESYSTFVTTKKIFFMLDYVIAKKEMLDKIEFTFPVKNSEEWLTETEIIKGKETQKHSDHVPLLIEF